MSSKNSNKLNIPQARAAMDKFKMEAASEDDVPTTYQNYDTDEPCPLFTKRRTGRASMQSMGARPVPLFWQVAPFLSDTAYGALPREAPPFRV